MDSMDLLARENEFKKLNKQLQKKTESLMKEIENVMQKQDIFSDISPNLRVTPPNNLKKHCCDLTKATTSNSLNNSNKDNIKNKEKVLGVNLDNDISVQDKNQNKYHFRTHSKSDCTEQVTCHNCSFDSNEKMQNDLEFLYAFVSVNVKDNILPHSFLKERVTVESVCKFLSAKVKLMQEQLNKMQSTIDKKTQQCESHLTQLAELESERMTLLNKANSMRADTADMRAKVLTLQGKLDDKDRLYKEQRSTTDRLTSELKQVKSKNASLEARCASQEEAVATLKQQLEIARITEKEFRDSTRSLSASHQNAISRLESRVKYLTSCIDKQNSLIDNLKKQNALLTAEGALKALEKEYSNLLNQDF
ncbi:unnamed protein product [Parnassius apollo]|uniref:(apollo) hypothetical protein n=1 Tax=Parnassius apollo TaxID=110799 RepID=A0A8S3X6J7_PARAO|nr:unnamed protein product [Parnassius apollo]